MDPLPKSGEEQFDIAIQFDGTWTHQGTPMTRMPLVRLFAGIMTRDAAGDYWLVTPVERGRIDVADAPFIVVGWRQDGGTLYLNDNLGREAAVDAAHPLWLRTPRGVDGPKVPYHQLGGGIEARLNTSVYYDLVELALASGGPNNDGCLSIASAGTAHPLGVLP
jgi:hypothetical protein